MRKRIYQRALALNNVAVRLMQRNCIPQAKECWLQTMRLMQTLVFGDDRESTSDGGEVVLQQPKQQ